MKLRGIPKKGKVWREKKNSGKICGCKGKHVIYNIMQMSYDIYIVLIMLKFNIIVTKIIRWL